MATVATTLPSFFSSDADFRTWGSAISAALATCSLVQTADTGQINWTTVTKPGSGTTAAGYEIWRFADTLQATAPVFIKVEYGVSGAVNRPSMWITVGSSSDGAGTITGQAGTRMQCGAGSSKTAGDTQPTYCSGDGSRIAVAFNQDTTNSNFPCLWHVARTQDATGATTSDGFAVAVASGVSNIRQTIPNSGTVPGFTGSTAWVSPNNGSTQATATATPLCPAILFAKGKLLFSSVLMHYVVADITTGSIVSVSVFGASHSYRALGPNQGSAMGGMATTATATFAMLWE